MSNGGFVGCIVISKYGHDKGSLYVIVNNADDKIALVSNGENRPLAAPKRKNIRHLTVTRYRTAATSDIEIKRAIENFRKEGEAKSFE